MTLSCSESTSVGKSAVGSNLFTSQTSISATSGKFGCKIGICKKEMLRYQTCLKFSRDISLGYPRDLIISVKLLRSRKDIVT